MTGSDASELDADLLVIGAGACGLAAAATASERGLRVEILEKRQVTGGNLLNACVIFAVESSTQRRLELDVPRDHAFKVAMDFAHWSVDPRLVRFIVNESSSVIDWIESQGIAFDDVSPFLNHLDATLLVSHQSQRWPHFGPLLHHRLVTTCEKNGTSPILGANTQGLTLDVNGRVTGATATVSGKKIHIRARMTLLATGGFEGNAEMLRQAFPGRYHSSMICSGLDTNTGDGIRLAEAAGADTNPQATLVAGTQVCIPYAEVARTGKNFSLNRVCMAAQTMWVNTLGQRYCAEWLRDHAPALCRQPGARGFALFDDQLRRRLESEPHYNGPNGVRGVRCSNLTEDLARESESGHTISANSWAEIAAWIGVAEARLEGTVAEYNRACDAQYDPVFNKDRRYLIPLREPPFHGVKFFQDFHGATGTLRVDDTMRILDRSGEPIPGLCSGGDACGGWLGLDYPIELGGIDLAFAFACGRHVARHMV